MCFLAIVRTCWCMFVSLHDAQTQDKKLKHVILSEKHDKKAAMFKVRSIPYPFTSREQYERSLKRAIGKEWNTHNSVQSLTKPEVMTKAGVIIAPLKAPKRKKKQK